MRKVGLNISREYDPKNLATFFLGDCLDFLQSMPSNEADLIVTSPPYNLGKEYEKKVELSQYIKEQSAVIRECCRVLSDHGSICWQVGNFVKNGSIVPIDYLLFPVFDSLGMKMKNRIVWHFEHGLHCTKRFSGRYEVILWFTKGDDYIFNLDPVRVPQKYPGKKYFKGPKAGEYSCNPKGKNPSDLWIIPNVKHNHVEKTIHPCQFPVELVERLVLSMTNPKSLVIDPFLGVGSTAVASIRYDRRFAGSELSAKYVKIAKERASKEWTGELKTRPMHKEIYKPSGNEVVARRPIVVAK